MTNILQIKTRVQASIRSTLSQGVVHPYLLNDKKAAKVLLENAHLPMVEKISETIQTTHVQLSTGAFSQVVFPLFSYWKTFPVNQVLVEGKLEATLKDVRIDEEDNGKQVDYLAKFVLKNKKISIFAYCTNQTLMIQGSIHKEFFKSFILPLLRKNFTQMEDKIKQYNQMVIKSLSSSGMEELDDSIENVETPERGPRNRSRKIAVSCEDCGKDYTNVSNLKLHIKNAHSDRTRAKPRVKSSRRMISVVPTSHPLGIEAESFPPLTYDADSELLLSDSESEVEVLEDVITPLARSVPALEEDAAPDTATGETSSLALDDEAAVDPATSAAGGVQPTSSDLDDETAEDPTTLTAGEVAAMAVGGPESMSPTKTTVSFVTLENGTTTHAKADEVTSEDMTTVPDRAPEEPTVEETASGPPAVHVEASVTVQNNPEVCSTDFQCAVCQKCFSSEGKVNKHFETHGTGESTIALMKEIFNMRKYWEDKFQKQDRALLALQHQFHVLQSRTAKSQGPPPPRQFPAPPTPSPAPASPPVSASPAPPSRRQTPAPPPVSDLPSHPSRRQTQAPACPPLPVSRQPPAFRPVPAPKGKRKILYIRDSVHRAVVGPKLENPTGSLIRSVNAYASVRDERAPENKRHLNVSSVVRRELMQSNGEDTLVLGAPSVDISNQDTTEGIIDENMTETIASSMAMVETAEYALKTGKVKQVILLEHLPRYDVEEKDNDKAELAKLANKELHKARDDSEYAENILVGVHSGLECQGRTRISRFTSDHTNGLHGRNIRMGKYDGVHMYSQGGAEALTKSILNIFQTAGMVKPSKQTPSQSSSRAEQEWIPSHQSRRRNKNTVNTVNPRAEVPVPVWEIPTQNMFQGFY